MYKGGKSFAKVKTEDGLIKLFGPDGVEIKGVLNIEVSQTHGEQPPGLAVANVSILVTLPGSQS